jgi:hypothetical protein
LQWAQEIEMSEHKGDAGTIYVTEAERSDSHRYDVWYEDFHIIGQGGSEIEALQDAAVYAKQLLELVDSALASYQPTLTPEETDLIIGAIPLQALPEG